jgi:CBS domain-containing protein
MSAGEIMKARDIMTASVASIAAAASVADAVSAMLDRRVSGLPVVESNGALVGIVTEGDFLRRAELGTEHKVGRWLRLFFSPGRAAVDYAHDQGRRVGDVMTAPAIAVGPDASVQEIVDLMTRHAVKRLPVVEDGRLVGIVSRSDLLRALDRSWRARPAPRPRSDAEILSDIRAEFERVPCIPSALIGVVVRDGAVTMHGSIMDERERDAIRVAVENTEGVKAIHDHLVWIEPMSGMALASPDDRAEDPNAGRIYA